MRLLGLLSLALPLCAANTRATSILDQAPLRFEEGTGANRFVVRGSGLGVQLRDEEARLQVRGNSGNWHQVRVTLPGAKHSPIVGEAQQVTKTSIFRGAESNWRKNISNFSKVRQAGVYPGVDLVYYGAGKQLEYDFVVAPNADPSRIVMRFSGAKASLNADGQLILRAGDAELIQHAPAIYQMNADGNPVTIAGGYTIAKNGSVGFRLGAYDRSRQLIIDPVISYSAYLGSTYADGVVAVGTDLAGALYITGYTNSTDLPVTPDVTQSVNLGLQDLFVVKIVNGAITYFTYLGGIGNDEPKAMAVGLSGNVYITGVTQSSDFPTTSTAYQKTLGGNSDAFLVRLDPSSGSLAYSSLLGGALDETGYGVAVAPGGIAYITGFTSSNDYPINSSNAFQGTSGGSYDMFVAKFDTTASGADSLPGSSYIGGGSQDAGRAIAIDPTGGVWVAGVTYSGDFPLFGNSYRQGYSGNGDAVLVKLNSALTAISYTSYFGGSDLEEVHKLTVDSEGKLYLAGITLSTDLPVTTNALQAAPNGNGDIFIAVLDPTKAPQQQVTYCTYFGGSLAEAPYDLLRDAGTGYLYLAGYTQSRNFPTTADALQSASAQAGTDGFVAILNPAKSGIDGLVFSSYVTGPGNQIATSLALAADGTLYVGGASSSSVFPDGNATRTTPKGSVDGFVMGLRGKPIVAPVAADPANTGF